MRPNMAPGFDSLVPCVCCNQMVLIRSRDWTSTSAAMCVSCYGFLPLQLIQVLYILRCQVGALHLRIADMQGDIQKLFTNVRELEELVLNEN